MQQEVSSEMLLKRRINRTPLLRHVGYELLLSRHLTFAITGVQTKVDF